MPDTKDLLKIFEHSLAEISFPSKARDLYTPIEYTLEPAGKRLRPMLCLKACEAFSGDPLKALNQAMAIEMFHNFTLIHDDVMDRSDTRRGKPTVFAKWGSTQAILSGDALLTIATQKAAEAPADKISDVLKVFNRTALEVYEGQQLDMDFENRDDVTTDEYLEMIRLKTSTLLGASCMIGAIMGGADPEQANAMYRFGETLGLSFQLRDDWLDTFGDPKEFGKPIGNDIRNRKKTYMFIKAQEMEPHKMVEAYKGDDAKLVERVTALYEDLGVDKSCDRLVMQFGYEAINCLEAAKITNHADKWFISLAQTLIHRTK